MTSFARGSGGDAPRWILLLLFATTVMVAGLLQLLQLRPIFANDTGGYPWYNATYVDANYDWGYNPCPSSDPKCMKMTDKGYGTADPWVYNLRNCTSYVAWKINQVFGKNIPGWGHASNWAYAATHNGNTYTLDSSPRVGDIAQWNGTKTNPDGHVAYVYQVSGGVATFDEYNVAGTGSFTSNYTSANHPGGAPNNYIHISTVSNPSTPSAVSRDSSDMAVFYNDGNGNLVNYSWNATTGWARQSWNDSGGILGQPAVVARTSDSMDVFYTTGQHKLIHKGWTASAGWAYFDVLLSGDVAGDPTVTARDSGDMQIFYRTLEGDIKSIYWSSVTGWNTNPQDLYVGAATTDPYAVSRSSDSMEVFFGKNNGNIVHLGWTPTYGWVTQDWSTNSTQSLPSKPTAVAYNSGGDMATYFQENNGNVGGESWDWQTGWSGQNWTAQLVGNPSAVPGVSNTVDDFYRETGGNIVDRYLSGGSWATTNIVGAGSATGNPFAIVRGTTNEEVFYWNGTSLMDANWNTTSQKWSTSQIN